MNSQYSQDLEGSTSSDIVGFGKSVCSVLNADGTVTHTAAYVRSQWPTPISVADATGMVLLAQDDLCPS